MLNIVYGRANSGKSKYVTEQAGALCRDNKRVFVLVPEQHTVSKEKEIIKALGNFASSRVVVTNFTRLCNEVMREQGGVAKSFISNAARQAVLCQSIDDVADKLSLYKKAAKSSDFSSTIMALVKELKAYKITPERLNEVADKVSDKKLAEKLKELSLIFVTYNANVHQGFSDSLDSLDMLCEMAASCDYFKDTYFFLDAYKSFTAGELCVIESLLNCANEVTVTFCCDDLNGDDIFKQSSDSAKTLIRLAKRLDIPNSAVKLSNEGKFDCEDIRVLEKELFNYSNTEKQAYNGDVYAFCAFDRYSEISFVAREIKRLVREKGVKFSDIAVIGRDMNSYKGLLHNIFKKYEIPVFIDNRGGMLTKPLITLVMSAFNAIFYNFRQEDVISILKTGIIDISSDKINAFENYVFCWDLRGADFAKDFHLNPNGYNKADNAKDVLKLLNEVREDVITPLLSFKEKLNSTSTFEISKAVYELLCDFNVYHNIERQADYFKKQGDLKQAAEYTQIYQIMLDCIDEITAISKKSITAKKYYEVLSQVLQNVEVGTIPTRLNEVVAGSANHMRSSGAQYVFIIGFNNGIFPKSDFDEGLITDREREQLKSLGIALAGTTTDKFFDEQFYLYCAITAAAKGICFTYPSADNQGKKMTPSFMLDRTLNLFDSFKVITETEEKTTEQKLDEACAFLPAFEMVMASGGEFEKKLSEYLCNKDDIRQRFDTLIDFEKVCENFIIPVTKKEFGLTPSRLERFRHCSFAYFCDYTLKIRAREKFNFDAPEAGTFIHHVLEVLLKQYDKTKIKSARDKLLNQIIGDYISDVFGDMNDKSERFVYLFKRLKRIIENVVDVIVEEFENSDFLPVEFELDFGKGDKVAPAVFSDSNVKVTLYGIADRVDAYSSGDKLYVRIVDYKTGFKTFDFNDVYNGLGLQMLVYLFSVWENGKEYFNKEIVPAGILYVPSQLTPVSVSRGTTEAEIDKVFEKKAERKGLILADDTAINAMDKNMSGKYLPLKYKSNGSLGAKSSVATLEQFDTLKEFVQKTLLSLCNEMSSGDIKANPFKDGLNSCQFCKMHSVCRFEPDIQKGKKYKSLNRVNFFEKLQEDADASS